MLMPAMRAMFLTFESALTLLVARVGADHAHDTLAPDHLAMAAHLLDRCCNFHLFSPSSLGPEHDPRPGQVVRRQFDRHLVAGPVSYTHLRAHETVLDLVCRLLLEK